MGRMSKTRGTGYEYRIRDWFKNEKESEKQPSGWEAERNSLSREEVSFGETTAKHDVKAWKDEEDGRIFLQIEAKKTGKETHTLQKEWLDKIDFTNDELLVIALLRTPHYAVITYEQFHQLGGTDKIIENAIEIKRRGKKSIRVHKPELEGLTWEEPRKLAWNDLELDLIVVPLFDFVLRREQLPPNVTEGLKEVEADIPVVEVDIDNETTINCPYTDKPIRLVPRSSNG